MMRWTQPIGLPVLLSMIFLTSSGCAAFEMTGIHTVYVANLDDGGRIEVNREFKRNLVLGQDHNYARLVLHLNDGPDDALHAEVARVTKGEQDPQRDDFWNSFDDVQLEGWADDTGTRVWIRNRHQEVIVATVDRKSRAVTKLGEPVPSWASANRGRRLEPLATSP